MDFSLLTTKIQIPPRPQDVVPRLRLMEVLQRSVVHHPLTLAAAPAGYGKTTLLAHWARSSDFPVAWLSLADEDDDLERFFRYLLLAWAEAHPDVMESPLGTLLGAMSPDSEAVLSAFINVGNEVPDHLVFILDDYHLIEDAAIHEALTFLLDHLPPNLHFVLAGRGEPPLPLARYRARSDLLELGARELRFRPVEATAFLNEVMGLDLPKDEIDGLQAEVEGWIAGLQLVALSHKQRLTEADELVVSGRHRFIADYLREDVLAPLPDDMRQFLLHTSILERLCASLCEAVTGDEGGQEMLETLERENLFLVPLDDRREWFRYHHLFAAFLREELKRRHPEEIAGLHRRAAHWYLAQDLPAPAFQHAVAGEDAERVIEIFDKYFFAKLNGGEFRVVERWIDSLPAAWYTTYPVLNLMRAGLLAYTGAFEACVDLVGEIEQRLAAAERQDTRWQLARVMAIRCFIACMENDLTRAEAYADHALRDLPDEDVGFRPGIHGALGDAYRRNGHWEEARECYLKALDFTDSPTVRLRSAHVFGALADLELRQGHLQNAAGYWSKALAAIQKRENWGRLPLPITGWVYIRMGELLYEWNELAEAWEHVTSGLERAELGGDVRAMIAGYLIAGRLKLTEGDAEAAEEYLEQARPYVENAQFAHWISRFERFQLELWLAEDRLRAAVNWADEMLQDEALAERPESEVAQLALARVLIVKGDGSSVDQALALLEHFLQMAEEEGRTSITIEALALEALAHWRRGDRAGAMTSLERALRLAEPEGYVRRFADLGLPMARILQEADSRDVMPDYVETLLAAFGGDIPPPTPDQQPLPEPLTDREQEVLELMAAGLTNREIAEELVISSGTVKKHASNIYGKLDVGSRTEAAARARELELLE